MRYVYAADIGGTNARFARFSLRDGLLAMDRVVWTQSARLADTDALLAALRQCLGAGPETEDALSVALAGPVAGLRGALTNGALRVDLRRCAEGLRACLLLNDFAAEAHATLAQPGREAVLVHGSQSDSKTAKGAGGTRAVFGAGTGLGAASLLRASGREKHWLAAPSEIGHSPFAFVGADEERFHAFLAQDLGQDYATVENVLCGRGLARLHLFLCGQRLTPAAVGAEALSRETPTLAWYARFLGRFARQWICATLCTGGLWIAGGIAARNPLCIRHPAFAHELERVPAMAALVRAVPIRYVCDTDSGLWGAAQAVLNGRVGYELGLV